MIVSRAVWKNLGSRRIERSLEKELGLGMMSRDNGSSWCTHCYDSMLKGLSKELTLVLSDIRKLDRVPNTK